MTKSKKNNIIRIFYKSLFYSVLISIIIPLLLFPFFILDKYDIIPKSIARISIPLIVELILTYQSYLWIVIRFIPIVFFSFLNAILISYYQRINNKTFLILSSTAIYFLSIIAAYFIFYFYIARGGS